MRLFSLAMKSSARVGLALSAPLEQFLGELLAVGKACCRARSILVVRT